MYTIVSDKRIRNHRDVIVRLVGNPKTAIQEVFDRLDAKPMPVTLYWVNSAGSLVKSKTGANGVFVGSNRHIVLDTATMPRNTVKVVIYA